MKLSEFKQHAEMLTFSGPIPNHVLIFSKSEDGSRGE